MYIGKHKGNLEGTEEKTIHIPENYAGTAFSSVPQEECISQELLPCKCEEPKESKTYSKAECTIPADALLILLAILLFGSEDGNELALVLLLLLFF